MKRILSLFLALVMMCGTLSPLTVMADPGDEEEFDPVFDAVNLSNAGAAQLTGYASATWNEALDAILAENPEANPHHDPLAAKTQVMIPAMDLVHWSAQYDEYPSYYIPVNTTGTWHELTLYSHEDVDPAAITLTGVRTGGGFVRHVVGDGEGALYYYTVRVFVPNTDVVMEIKVNGVTVNGLPITHVYSGPVAPLVTTLWVEDYTEDDTGTLIQELKLRISGFALWDDAADYQLQFGYYDSENEVQVQRTVPASAISAEDENGYRLLTFRFGDGIPGTALMWPDLVGPEQESIMFFGKSDHLDPDSDLEGMPIYRFKQALPYYGSNARFASPYYCINKPAPSLGEAPAEMPELVVLARERGDGMLCTQLTHVEVYQNPGSYLDGDWSLSADGVNWNDWLTVGGNQAKVLFSFADSGKYGDYTIHARFRKEGLRTVTLKCPVNYNNGVAPVPGNPAILDAGTGQALKPDESTRYVLRGDADKAFTFTAVGYPRMAVNLYFKSYDESQEQFFQTGSVVPMTYNADAKRYEVTLKKSQIPEDAVAVSFWTAEAEGYLTNSDEITLSIVNMEPLVFRPLAPNYSAERRVDDAGNVIEVMKPGDEIECLLTASSGTGWTREVKMTYTDMDGASQTLTGTFAPYGDSRNSFRAVFTVPEDAKQLGAVTYRLFFNGAEADQASYDLSACCVAADAVLTGIPGSCKGMRLTLSHTALHYKRTFVLSGESSLNLGDLTPASYDWELEGKSGHIIGGSFTITRGGTAALPELPALGSVTVKTVGFQSAVNGKDVLPEATVTLELTTPDGVTRTVTAAPGARLEEIPVGTECAVSLTWDTSVYEEVSGYTPASGDITVSGDETLTFTFQPFTMRTVSGTLYGVKPNRPWFTPWGTQVVLTQNVTRGGKTEVYTKTLKITSATGNKFSFQCYDNIPATIQFRSLTWSGDPVEVAASGSQALGSVLLHDGGEKLIQVKAQARLPRYLNADGTVRSGVSTDPVALDSAFLEIQSVNSGNKDYGKDSFETFVADGQLWLKLKEGVVAGNDVIDVRARGTMEYGQLSFSVYEGYSWQSQSRRARDLGNGTGEVTFTAAMTGGELRATVVDDADSGMTGFLMYFSTYGETTVCQYVCGTGELHLAYPAYEVGSHTVMSLMVRNEDVSAMANVLRSDPKTILNQIPADSVEKLVMQRSSAKKYCFRENTVLASNAYVYLDDMIPNVNVGSDILPPYGFAYDVSLTENASTLLVTGTLTKRFPDVIDRDAVKSMHIYVADANGDVNAEVLDGTVNGRGGYGGYYAGAFTYHDDVIQFKAPLNNYNELRFKVVLVIGTPGASYDQRTIEFTFNDTIPVFTLSGPTNVYLADQLDAQGLAEGANDKTYDAANWKLHLALRSFGSRVAEEMPITIWDNGVAIWQGNLGSSAYFWPIDVRLTDNLTPGVHVLWATRTYNGQEISTEPLVINLMSGREKSSVYVSDLTWTHWNSRTADSSVNGDVMHFKSLSELAGQTIWLWPGKRTDMRFRVNNATTKELKGVSVRFYGVRVRGRFLDNITADIPCTCIYESKAGNFSEWKFENASMGYFYTFEFVFDYQPAALSELSHQATEEERRVAELEATYQACGLGEVPDYTDAVDALAEIDTKEELQDSMSAVGADLPDALGGLDLKATENAGTYEIKLNTATDTIKDYSLKVSDIGEMPAHEIYALMEKERSEGNQDPDEAGWQVCWAELDGIQGSTVIRMAVHKEQKSDGTWGLTMHRTVYLTSEAARAIEDGNSLEAASANRVPGDPGPLYDGGDPPAHWIKQGYDVVSYINSTGDITQDLYVAAVKDTYKDAAEAAAAGKEAKFMPKHLGDAMNILGVADAAISISSGPSGKDSMGLYMLLSNVKDQKFREQIESQLRDYDQIRMDIYAQDTAMSAVGAGANFVPDPTPITKIVCFLGGIGNSIISGWAKDYNRQVYNTTLCDIQRQIRFEQYKEMRAEMDEEFKKMVERRFGKDVANNPRLLMEEKKHWVLGTDEFGDPKWRLRENVPEYNTYQDPSGYVFEAVEENRVDGVTATLYFSETEDGTYSVWHDPAAEPQINPQHTTAEGRYQWMVPEGWWKVRYEKNGYLVAESRAMEVPPAHTAVNIGLLSTEAHTAAVKATDGSYTVAFSKYMQVESLVKNGLDYSADTFDAAGFAVRFLDENGDPVPGTVTFPDKTANTGYKGTGYGVDVIPSDWFARNAVFTPEAGHTVKSWSLGKGMVSYAGVELTDGTAELYLIRLDAAGGEPSAQDLITGPDGKLTRLPEPCRDGYLFRGWYDGETIVTPDTVFTADAVITARWEIFGGYTVSIDNPAGQPLTVTFTNGTAEEGPVTCVTALYDADGQMLLAESAGLTIGTSTITPTTDYGASLRTFCYGENYVPLAPVSYLKLRTD